MSLRTGKLPPALLARLLQGVDHADPRVLLGPGVGRDAAIIDIGGGSALVATSDPVTFATDDIGWYAVNVNANDVACMGARPAWFLATVLLPEGSPDVLPSEVFAQISRAAATLGVEVVGGHTEVTSAVDRPIIAGTMLGVATAADIITGEGISAGDAILLGGGIAIEGTALLAREAAASLTAAGLGAEELARARRLLFDPGISIVNMAGRLRALAQPRLLHDPTEGGIATALHEMAAAAGMTFVINPEAIEVLPETRAVSAALRLDPMGLLASGALLAVVDPEDVARIESDNPSTFRRIGRVERGEPTVIMEPGSTPFPMFERDELARFFDGMA